MNRHARRRATLLAAAAGIAVVIGGTDPAPASAESFTGIEGQRIEPGSVPAGGASEGSGPAGSAAEGTAADGPDGDGGASGAAGHGGGSAGSADGEADMDAGVVAGSGNVLGMGITAGSGDDPDTGGTSTGAAEPEIDSDGDPIASAATDGTGYGRPAVEAGSAEESRPRVAPGIETSTSTDDPGIAVPSATSGYSVAADDASLVGAQPQRALAGTTAAAPSGLSSLVDGIESTLSKALGALSFFNLLGPLIPGGDAGAVGAAPWALLWFAGRRNYLLNQSPAVGQPTVSYDPALGVATGSLGATDPDGDALTYAVVSGPRHGTVVVHPDGSYTYVADEATRLSGGTDSFTVRIDDNDAYPHIHGLQGLIDLLTFRGGQRDHRTEQPVTIGMDPANGAPDITITADGTLASGAGSATFTVGATDPEGDDFTIDDVRVDDPHGTLIDNGGGSYTYTPDRVYRHSQAGGYDVVVTVTATDEHGASSTRTRVIHVESVNDAPAIDDVSVVPGQLDADQTSAVITVSASDPDGDDVTVTVTSSPRGTVVDNGNGTFTYTPRLEDRYTPGGFTEIITITVTDDRGVSTTRQLPLVVAQVNRVPTVAVETADPTVPNGADSVQIVVSAADPDGDAVHVVVTPPAHGTVGAVTDNGDGTYSFTYTPDPDKAHAGGFTETLTVTVRDGNGGVTSVAVPVTVQQANKAPEVTVPGAVTVPSDGLSVEIPLTISDPDAGDTAAVQVTGAVKGAALYNPATGKITYTPDRATALAGGFSETLTVTVDDGHGGVVAKQVVVTVEQADPPFAVTVPGTATVPNGNASVDIPVVIDDPDVAAGASVQVSGATRGTAFYEPATGAVRYTPTWADAHAGGFAETLTVTVDDGAGGVVVKTVVVTVERANNPPVIDSIVYDDELTEDEVSSIITVGTSDADPGDTLAVTVTAGTGTVKDNGDGTFTYTPSKAERNGTGTYTDTITVTIDDGHGGVVTQTRTITVHRVESVAPVRIGEIVISETDGRVYELVKAGSRYQIVIREPGSAEPTVVDIGTVAPTGPLSAGGGVAAVRVGNDVIRTDGTTVTVIPLPVNGEGSTTVAEYIGDTVVGPDGTIYQFTRSNINRYYLNVVQPGGTSFGPPMKMLQSTTVPQPNADGSYLTFSPNGAAMFRAPNGTNATVSATYVPGATEVKSLATGGTAVGPAVVAPDGNFVHVLRDGNRSRIVVVNAATGAVSASGIYVTDGFLIENGAADVQFGEGWGYVWTTNAAGAKRLMAFRTTGTSWFFGVPGQPGTEHFIGNRLVVSGGGSTVFMTVGSTQGFGEWAIGSAGFGQVGSIVENQGVLYRIGQYGPYVRVSSVDLSSDYLTRSIEYDAGDVTVLGDPWINADRTKIHFLARAANGTVSLYSIDLDAGGRVVPGAVELGGSAPPISGTPVPGLNGAEQVGHVAYGPAGERYVLVKQGSQYSYAVFEGTGSSIRPVSGTPDGDLIFDGGVGSQLVRGASNDSVALVRNKGTQIQYVALSGTGAAEVESAGSRRVFVVTETTGVAVNVVDPATGTVQRISLPGNPVLVHSDGAGTVRMITHDGTSYHVVVIDPVTGSSGTELLPGTPVGGIRVMSDGTAYVITDDPDGTLAVTVFPVPSAARSVV